MKELKKKIVVVMGVTILCAIAVFLLENVFPKEETFVGRNSYGEGKKTESYYLEIEGQKDPLKMDVEVQEQEYDIEETKEMFQKVMKILDEVVPGENESFERVEKDLKLVSRVEEYPVRIQWELSSYDKIGLDGKIKEEDLPKEGTMLELKGHLTYREEEAVYVRHVMLYPLTRKGVEGMLYEVKKMLSEKESQTRLETGFDLPKEWNGRKLTWTREQEQHWYYVLLIGVVFSVFLIYRRAEERRQEERRRREELLREYPGLISKFAMLLSAGITVKSAWEKIVQQMGEGPVYEEMKTTLHEMQSGVPEGEAYERFGKRCNVVAFLKFGALLSQNLKKGSKGLSGLLRVEAIQSFEHRKGRAKQKGEEAGAKLLMPMVGMLAVVLIMVMVPAFLTMQL